MNVAVIHLKVAPNRIEELKKAWQPMSVEAKKTKGLTNALLLTNQQSGDCLAVGFWESLEAAKAFKSNPIYQSFVSQIKEYLVSAPHRDVYEVTGDISSLSAATKAA